ncbi:MAG: peptidoglycan editing factor PgeF [Betaproteobacteria bacterium HGW-Betaproteobacteria-11]|nr:MAG: peptidoglycan editing factor PgeF [Betaproteobacteria bacterium HGW-Betaproteobacteria-11]
MNTPALDLIHPDWPAPRNVHALVTTRQGGVSQGPWARLNLAAHVGDEPAAVAENRRRLCAYLPAEPVWLNQVHGVRCVDAGQTLRGIDADASFTRTRGVVCAVLTADCLPLLFCDEAGSVVAAVHAGWKGLAAGVIEAAVAAMAVPGERLLTWLGPAIGADHFEVGDEVREAFLAHDAHTAEAFVTAGEGKWRGDLYQLARQRLLALGVQRISGSDTCTMCESERFYSFRRDEVTGRMASCIWLA